MKFCLFGGVAVLIATIPCTAAVFERDWKTPGDGLLTFDDVNHREWLDLSVSRLEQFSGSTLEQRYQSAVAELAPGGQLEGFSVAKRGDVIAFAQSAGIDTSTDDFATNYIPVSHVIDQLSATVQFPGSVFASLGLVDEFHALTRQRNAAIFYIELAEPPFIDRAALIFGGSDFIGLSTGLMLYRVVPEPSTLVLILTTAGFCRG